MTRPVSGEQVTIAHGPFRAQVGQLAAVLRGCWHGDQPLTENWPDDWVAPMGAGLVLVPWPNRVAGAVWESGGGKQQLDITEPARGNAIHGLLRNAVYDITARSDRSVTLAATIYPQHGYPFTLDTAVTYALDDAGLTVTHTLINVGADAAPFGVGAHPYLRVGEVPPAELTITLSARTRVVVDDRVVPTGLAPVQDSPVDLRSGRVVGSLGALDGAFTDFDSDGRVEHRLSAPDGRSVVLWADEVFGWAQVYTPAIFPGPGKPNQRTAIAVEPMTCAADAFHNGWGLQHLAPGETWSGSWGLRAEGF